MPGTDYEDGATEDLMRQAQQIRTAAVSHEISATKLRAALREILIELRSRNVPLIPLARAIGVSGQRIAAITKGDDRVYGPDYAAERASPEHTDVPGDADVREPGP